MKIQACFSCTDICCKRTTYKLTNADIGRILEVYTNRTLFTATIQNIDGTIQLRQPCYFLKDNKCSIYNNRPVGCRLGPVVWNNAVTVDESCPGHKEILHPERHSILIHKYLWNIATEAKERMNNELS